jgi:hypothetical protein
MKIISTSGDRFDKQMARLQKSAKALELDFELIRWTGSSCPPATASAS